MTLMTLAAAAAEEDRGWGGIVAMLIAVGLYAAIRYGMGQLRERLDGSDETDDAEDSDDEQLVDEPEQVRPPWWRGVVDGLWDRDPQPLPSPTEDADHAEDTQATAGVTPDDTSRDTTNDGDWHGQIVTLADGRRVRAVVAGHTTPVEAEPAVDVAEEDDAALDEWCAAQLAAVPGLPTSAIVEAGMRRGASKSTVYRALRRARQT